MRTSVALPASPASRTRPRSRQVFFRKKVVPWLFVLPILLINVAVVLGPALSAVYYSMTNWSGLGRPNGSASPTSSASPPTEPSATPSPTTSSGWRCS
jgi:ABC-type sugar transport system permease subunit